MTDKPNAIEEIILKAIGKHNGTASWPIMALLGAYGPEMRDILAGLDAAGYEVRLKIPVEGKVS